MTKIFDAEGVFFRLTPGHFIIESSAGVIFEATESSEKIWYTNEGEGFPSFSTIWEDLRCFIAEIASSLWSEENYNKFFVAVDAIFSTN